LQQFLSDKISVGAAGMFDGVRSRFPFLLPILKQETVARRIITAVRRNAVELQMPPLVYTTDMMRGLFPAWVFDKTVRVASYCRTMA
jgi:all-trans-retinol dehydrogenase (NAD+)